MSFQLFSTISSQISILMFFKFHILIKFNKLVLMQPYLIKKLVQNNWIVWDGFFSQLFSLQLFFFNLVSQPHLLSISTREENLTVRMRILTVFFFFLTVTLKSRDFFTIAAILQELLS